MSRQIRPSLSEGGKKEADASMRKKQTRALIRAPSKGDEDRGVS